MRKNDQHHYFSSEEIANLHSLVKDMDLCARIAQERGPNECSDVRRQKDFLVMKLKEYSTALRIGCKLIHPDRARYAK